MKTIKSLYTVLAISGILFLASLHAMEKEVSNVEVKPLVEIIFDYLVKWYDPNNKDITDEQRIRLLHGNSDQIILVPQEITENFLKYIQKKYPNFLDLALPEIINLSSKEFLNEDNTAFFRRDNDHRTFYIFSNGVIPQIIRAVSFAENVSIVDIKPAQAKIGRSEKENSFYVLAVIKEKSWSTKKPATMKTAVYKVNLKGMEFPQYFSTEADWETIQEIQFKERDLGTVSLPALLTYALAKKQYHNKIAIDANIKNIIDLEDNYCLDKALAKILNSQTHDALLNKNKKIQDKNNHCTIL